MFHWPTFIDALLKQKRINQAELAKRLQVSPAYVTLMLQGKQVPPDDICATLETMADLKPHTLMVRKALNRLEAAEADLSLLNDPEILAEHGLLVEPIKKGKTPQDEMKAAAYVRKGDWQGLIAWSAAKLAASPAKGR